MPPDVLRLPVLGEQEARQRCLLPQALGRRVRAAQRFLLHEEAQQRQVFGRAVAVQRPQHLAARRLVRVLAVRCAPVPQPLPSRHRSIVAVTHTLPVSPGERWRVVLHDDDHNLIPVVHYLLHKICGHDRETARDLTMAVNDSGGAVVGVHDRETAEAVTVELLRHGLSASFRRAG